MYRNDKYRVQQQQQRQRALYTYEIVEHMATTLYTFNVLNGISMDKMPMQWIFVLLRRTPYVHTKCNKTLFG